MLPAQSADAPWRPPPNQDRANGIIKPKPQQEPQTLAHRSRNICVRSGPQKRTPGYAPFSGSKTPPIKLASNSPLEVSFCCQGQRRGIVSDTSSSSRKSAARACADHFEAASASWTHLREPANVGARDRPEFWIAPRWLPVRHQNKRLFVSGDLNSS